MADDRFTYEYFAEPPRLLPIVRSSDLRLLPRGYGGDARFAGIFHRAWRRIPLWARRRMTAHWRKPSWPRLLAGVPVRPVTPGAPRASLVSPRVELLYEWTGGRLNALIEPGADLATCRGGGRHEYAFCACEGHVLRFCAPHVDRMPDEVAMDLVAHELAHVVQYATATPLTSGPPTRATGRWSLTPTN
jgi:hypothetical protein